MGSIHNRPAAAPIPSATLRTHQPVVPNHIQAAPTAAEIKVKTRTPERMQEIQQAAVEKGNKVLGSSAQVNLIKAKIEQVSVPDIQDQSTAAPLSKTETAKKYGLTTLRVVGAVATLGVSEVVQNADKIKRIASNTKNNLDISVANRYANRGSKAKQAAFLLKSVVNTNTELAGVNQELAVAKASCNVINKQLNTRPQPEPKEVARLTDKLGTAIHTRDELKVKAGLLKNTLTGLKEQMGRTERIQDLLGQRAELRQSAQTLPLQIAADQALIQELDAQVDVLKAASPGKFTPEANALTDKIGEAQQRIDHNTEKLGSVNTALNTHRTETQSLITLSQALEQEAAGDKALGKEILNGAKGIAHEYAFKGTLNVTKLAHSGFSLVKHGAVAVEALKGGIGGALNITDATKEAAAASLGMTTSAISTVSLIAAPVTILVEGYALKKSVQELSGALNKTEKAEALLSDKGRASLSNSFEKQLKSAQKDLDKTINGSTFHKANPQNAEKLQAKIAGLESKIEALKNLPAPEHLSKESEAVAKQIIKHSDKGFKAASAFKSTLAITAASLTIASLCLGPAAPIGLAVAATVIGVAAGVYGISMLVAKFKIPKSRSNKIEKLQNNHQQIQMKRSELTQSKDTAVTKHQEISTQKTQVSAKLGALKNFQQSGTVPAEAEQTALGLKATDFVGDRPQTLITQLGKQEKALTQSLAESEANVNQIDDSLLMLSDLQAENTLQLLASSPYDAAKVIHEGATAVPPDKSMRYLAEKVLGVDCLKLSPAVAIEELARGMSLKPGS